MSNIQRYGGKNVGEMREIAVRKDNKIDALAGEIDEQVEGMKTARYVRGGSTIVSSLLVGLLLQKQPQLESLGGSGVGLSHILGFGGAVAAVVAAGTDETSDTMLPDIAEGIAMAGLVPVLRGWGNKLGRST
ncbi:MAG: hypothetical protein K0V04_16125 [Deltaproteobacteria bacterium]|nr:hypothetical protein [Deltaproteobacteria bacterium]